MVWWLGQVRVVIEFVRGDVPAVFPLNSKVVDEDLLKLLYVFKRGKKGNIQIGLHIKESMFSVGEGHPQNVII